jgi:VanZ family protein
LRAVPTPRSSPAARWLWAWLPALAWAALLFVASATPGSKLPPLPGGSDKLVHAGIYAVLGARCWRGVRRTSRLPLGRAAVVAAALSTLYGVSDELHQAYTPLRTPDVHDALADAAGSLAGALVCAWRVRRRAPRTPSRSPPSP